MDVVELAVISTLTKKVHVISNVCTQCLTCMSRTAQQEGQTIPAGSGTAKITLKHSRMMP